MEAIHGITFIDYAAACAFMAQGKDIKELIPVLGVEMPQWDEANQHWQDAMANDPNFKLVNIFGEVFQNPAQGKFSGSSTQTSNDVLEKIPTLERFIEIQEMMNVASSFGIDAQHFLHQEGLTIMDYSQSGMHWMKVQNELLTPKNPDYATFGEWFSDTHLYYKEKYEKLFQEQQGGRIGDDVEF